MEDPIIVMLRNIRLITVNLPLRLGMTRGITYRPCLRDKSRFYATGNLDDAFEALRDATLDGLNRLISARAA